MKTKLLQLAVVISIVLAHGFTTAQDRSIKKRSNNEFFPMAPKAPKAANVPLMIMQRRANHKSEKMSGLEEVWRASDSEDDRAKVEEMVAEIISEQFEEDIERRKAEMEKIMDRVAQLKKQLDRRIRNKDEIVSIQVKQTTMTWDGLGWNGTKKEGPMPGLAYGVGWGNNSWTAEDGGGGSLAALVEESALGDKDRLEFLTSKLADSLKEADSASANEALWRLYENTRGKVKSRGYWSKLIEAGEAAIEHAESGTVKANTLDTVARMYEQLGDREKALELQLKAVELQPHNGELKGYLKQLQTGDDDEEMEFGSDRDDASDGGYGSAR